MLINTDVRITGLIKQHIPPTILSAADTGEGRKSCHLIKLATMENSDKNFWKAFNFES